MASRRFFTYDPYDYYYAKPYQYAYPYYRHHQQAPGHSVGGFFPVAGDTDPVAVRPAARPSSGPATRSVSIPVQFIGSDPEPERNAAGSRAEQVARLAAPTAAAVTKKRAPSAEAVVRLQAAARGFLARRTVRAVREVEREAEEVAARVARDAEALRGDARARIAAGEALMRLLLRLDAVRGAREFRRKVTKKVLALQDTVDALEPKPVPSPDAAAVAEEPEASAADKTAESAVAPGVPDAVENCGETEAKAAVETAAEMEVDGARAAGERGVAEETEQTTQDGANLDGDMPDDAEGEWEMMAEEPAPAAAACPEVPRQEPAGEEAKRTAEAGAGTADGVDARKVMEMVAALCERSAQQCAVIGALAERVDTLERAVRRVEDGERRRRRAKKLRKEGKGCNSRKCYSKE